MVLTPSTMTPLGAQAPAFSLPNVDGTTVSLSDFNDADALLVMFICNHCPYVIHVADELAKLGNDYRERNVGVVAISANDAANYPDDGPEKIAAESKLRGYTFPYLYDESQDIAKAYGAVCTPDFFLFDRARRLIYRGQLDDSRPGSDTPVTGKDLRSALDTLLSGATISLKQKPSVGCSIKWRPGNEPT